MCVPDCCQAFPVDDGCWRNHGETRLRGAVGTQGLVDPGVPELVLAVDASSVDTQQDGYAMPGAAGAVGGGHARVELESDAAVPVPTGESRSPSGRQHGSDQRWARPKLSVYDLCKQGVRGSAPLSSTRANTPARIIRQSRRDMSHPSGQLSRYLRI
jgi:hypothetical protein